MNCAVYVKRWGAAYVLIYCVEKRRRTRHETDADASRDDLAETVEAQDAPDGAVAGLGFESKVGRDAWTCAEVHEVVRIVYKNSFETENVGMSMHTFEDQDIVFLRDC